MNPVAVILGLAATAVGSVGLWTFASALLTRKSDTKRTDVSSTLDLETASQSYRNEVRAELDAYKKRDGIFTGLVVTLLRTLDSFAPKITPCLTDTERDTLKAQSDAVWAKAVE